MMNFQVITNSDKLVEAVKQFVTFSRMPFNASKIVLSTQIPPLFGQVLLLGDDSPMGEQDLFIQRVRKKNLLQPILFLGGEVSDAEKTKIQHFEPVYICSWPYNSLEFFAHLKKAEETATKRTGEARKLQTINGHIRAGKGKEAHALILEIQSVLSPCMCEILKGKAFLCASKFDQALVCGETALGMHSNLLEGLEVKARALAGMGKNTEAIQLLEGNKKIVEHDADCLVLLADLCLLIGRLNESMFYHNMALKLDPNSKLGKTGKFVVGVLNGSITSVSGGKSAGETSLELAKLCNEKAIMMVKAGQFDLAEKLYQNTMQLLPDKSYEYKLFMNLGLCMKKAGKVARALHFFQEGQTRAPEGYNRFKEQIASLPNGGKT